MKGQGTKRLTCKCLTTQVVPSIKGMDVVDVMERIQQDIGTVPELIQVDNGSEFISKALDKWTYDTKLRWSPPDQENP